PFNLQLVLSPLAQGDTLNQVADRAALTTRISKQGQVVTDARYFVKNRGQPHFRLVLPAGAELWSATVNGVTAVPRLNGKSHLIPLPQNPDPNAIATVDLKLASRSKDPERVSVAAPIVGAPVLLSEWKFLADAGQRLIYRKGSLAPAAGISDSSGFAALFNLLRRDDALIQLGLALALLVAGLFVWRWSSRPGVYKFSAQHTFGLVLGMTAVLFSVIAFMKLGTMGERVHYDTNQVLTFLAPIQPENNALAIEVDNIVEKPSVWRGAWQAWPVVLALAAFVFAFFVEGGFKTLAKVAGWTLLFWTALRFSNGVPLFFGVLVAFIVFHLLVPAFLRLMQAPPKPKETPPPDVTVPAVALTIGALLVFVGAAPAATNESGTRRNSSLQRFVAPIAESVTQDIRVDEKFAFARAKVRWTAINGQTLPILLEPAVLTRINFPTNALKLVDSMFGQKRRYELVASEAGTFDIEFDYQLQPTRRDDETGFSLPTQRGIVNELALTLVNLDVEIVSAAAVSIESKIQGSNTFTRLVLSPQNDAWIGWRPRSRDTKREKPVFYAEIAQLYVPSAGVIEGQHQVQIRPAQGQLSELIFNVPAGATITDVYDASATNRAASSLVSVWRFDPDTRQLRVTLKPAQAKPFTLIVRSQIAVGPLPVEQRVGLLSVTNAAGQIGLLGIATGSDVQLDNVTTETLSPINLE
ncbi:MAG TPA: hypothetical protein VK530_20210, partial [Candidatus Acidoferrum sp.]|nr:hypothetical protein [Candidatus Acidoferrum sp.]